MKGGFYVGIVYSVLILCAVCLAAGWICMRIALDRSRDQDPMDPESIAKTSWSRYREPVLAGAGWIAAQEKEELSLTSFDGLRLSARLLPAAQNRGTILLFHGYRSAAALDFSCGSRFYHELGFNLLLVDQRSHGESEGRYITYGVLERRDCQKWAEYCAGRFGPSHPLFLGGISMGASTVLMAAGLPLPPSVRGVIADCGFTSPWEILREVMTTRCHLPVFPFLYLTEFMTRLCAGFSLKGASTVEALSHACVPVLLIHGTGDRFVPCRMSREAYAACRSEKRLLLVEGAGHAASYLADREAYTAAVREFLFSHTG